jgi:hypothetical protein
MVAPVHWGGVLTLSFGRSLRTPASLGNKGRKMVSNSKMKLIELLGKDPAKIPAILKFLMDTPPRAKVQDLVPLDEVTIRV